MDSRPSLRPTVAEISLPALAHNVGELRRLVPGVGLLAMMKADAYGHGAVEIGRALERLGLEMLGVALVEEGMELRRAGVRAPILVLGGPYGDFAEVLEHGLTPVLYTGAQLERARDACRKAGRTLAIHAKVDTGMGRLGLQLHEVVAFAAELAKTPELELDGVLSHFASADSEDRSSVERQLGRFREAAAPFTQAGLFPRYRHISNSAALDLREGGELNLARPGLMLYGLHPSARMKALVSLTPVLSLKTAIVHLKGVPPGTAISYGGRWTSQRESLIATLPIGYADGYARALGGKASVLVRGQRAPVVGTVCMDMCMADVTEVVGVCPGDEVVLIGRQGGQEIHAAELADKIGTISYEVLCAISARVPRRFVGAL